MILYTDWWIRGFTAYTHADKTTTSLSQSHHYIYRLTTTGTGTDTGACYTVWYYKGNSMASNISQRELYSNHPLLRINGSTVEIYTNHQSSYSIRYVCERYETGDDDSRPRPLVQISSGREILMIYTTIQDHGHLKNSVYSSTTGHKRMVLETSMKHSDLQITDYIIGTILFLMKVVMVIVSTCCGL